eukprot:TRINITY_DN2547_c0_g1_i12.p1 TRINITY_DN2547_c0_g1~~TRINITY_DN2547_c0_g1_i12.p1  ORF type:complete len:395 (+),score=74.77 TRINITY_DN2547_c0_g1_i12:744-1928(+)
MASEQQEEGEFRSPLIVSREFVLAKGVPEHLVGIWMTQAYRLGFGVSSWYDRLAPYTFPSNFVQLTPEEIQAILREAEIVYQQKFTEGDSSEWEYTQENRDMLLNLEGRLDVAVDPFRVNGCFVKLNSRSPKDVITENERTKSFVFEATESQLKTQTQKRFDQILLDGFMIGSMKSLCVKTGKQALLLLLCSDRIRDDLSVITRLFPFGFEPPSVVIREWDENVIQSPYREFRCFVCNNSLNAISQYDHLSYYPVLIEKREEIEGDIRLFFENVLREPLKTHESYVFDVFYGQDRRCKLIELNSFGSFSGGCLFEWGSDKEILLHGPLELRLVTKPSDMDYFDLVPNFWQSALKLRFSEEFEKHYQTDARKNDGNSDNEVSSAKNEDERKCIIS